MKLAFISDTHMMHEWIAIPPCDVLVHAGDFCSFGRRDEVERFLDWLDGQPATFKVLIAGNHDFFCERSPTEFDQLRQKRVIYLNDSGVELLGVSFWGSPVTPSFNSWAFNRERGGALRRHWDLIPDGVDVLVTHGPPRGLGDMTDDSRSVGCDDLLEKVRRVEPRVHAFGHVHEGRGEYSFDGLRTRFLNVSSLDSSYRVVKPPVVIDLETK